MTAARVMLLEAAGPESIAITETASSLGYQVHAVTQPERWSTYDNDLRQNLSGHLLTDFTAPEQALADVVVYARRIRAVALLTTNEYLTPLAARGCAELGLPGNDPALAVTARNKADMVQRLSDSGIPTPRTRIVHSRNEIERLAVAGDITYPCVLKPAEGAGSSGVTVVASPDQIIAAHHAAQKPCGMYGLNLDPRVLLQAYVDGTEFSIESMTQSGITTHLCITRKIVTSGAKRIEIGHGLPAELSDDQAHAMLKIVSQAVAAAGISNGPSHTEVIARSDGTCCVLELGARIGAGQISWLIQHALGIDPWRACLDIAMGLPAKLTATRNGYAAVRFLTSPVNGRLISVTGLPEPSSQIPSVRMRMAIGEAVKAPDENASRIGSFIVVGLDERSVIRHADELMSQVRIEVEPS